MSFYKHCDNANCMYPNKAEGRTRLDAPTLRERLTNNYRCWNCDLVQELDETDRAMALEQLLDRVEALEAKVP
jgi:hypothetical protein